MLLTTYLANQMLIALRSMPPSSVVAAPPLQHRWENRTGKEQVIFTEKLRGLAVDEALAARQAAEDLAIGVGGLRDALQAVDKLTFLPEFGRTMGIELETTLELQHLEAQHLDSASASWVDTMYDNLGKDDSSPAPLEAVQAIRAIIIKHCGEGTPPEWSSDDRTSIDVQLLEAWRKRAKDPDSAITRWLAGWAPAGITQQAEACGIFPEINEDSEMHHSELVGNIDNFTNYSGGGRKSSCHRRN